MKTTLAISFAAVTALALGMPAATSAQGPAAAASAASVSAANPASGKVPGKIRVGVAPSQAQLGQGNNAGDFGTPIRNSIILIMSGPAVDIVPLDSHLAMQVQAEAQQKQCDFVLYSSVTVKHNSGGGGFGGFLKKAGPAAAFMPLAGVGGGLGGAVAGQAAGIAATAAIQTAEQQAVSELAGFNGQIKSKDDVTVGYQVFATGQDKPMLQNALNGKAKSDGEDVLTPLILKAADTILTEVTKK
jgi:hypothetical protein